MAFNIIIIRTTSWNYFMVKIILIFLIFKCVKMHFDYACSTWYSNLTMKTKHRIQTTQNKCKRFCVQLDKLKHISHGDFEPLNWLTVIFRFKERVNSIVFKYFNEQCHNYLNKVFDVATESNFHLRNRFKKKIFLKKGKKPIS